MKKLLYLLPIVLFITCNKKSSDPVNTTQNQTQSTTPVTRTVEVDFTPNGNKGWLTIKLDYPSGQDCVYYENYNNVHIVKTFTTSSDTILVYGNGNLSNSVTSCNFIVKVNGMVKKQWNGMSTTTVIKID